MISQKIKLFNKKDNLYSVTARQNKACRGNYPDRLCVIEKLFIKKIFYMCNIFTLVHYDKSSAAA